MTKDADSMEELKNLIKGEIGRNIIFLEEVDSTNTRAVELAEKGAVHGTVVIAESQKKGRGRMGRAWVSPPSRNIYMSVIAIPSIEAKDATLLTIMAGVACCSALREMSAMPVGIKWPNDLMMSDKKLGGILTELKSAAGKIIFAVVGIGINVNMRPEDFPLDLGQEATSVMIETGEKQSKIILMAGILNELDRRYRMLIDKGRIPLLDEWRSLSSTLGKSVRVTAGREVFSGIAEDIDEEGMLILRLPDGIKKTISIGELTIMKQEI